MAGYLGWSHRGPCQPLRICEPIKLELHRGVVTLQHFCWQLCAWSTDISMLLTLH